MINFIRLLSMRNNELLQFLKDVITRCERFDLTDLLLIELVTDFKNEVSSIENVYKKMTGSKLTDLIVAIDDKRDDAISGIKITCVGLQRHFAEDFVNAASLIIESYEPYNEPIAKLNYNAETAAIDSITKEWGSNTALSGAFATLNLSSWIDELKSLNASFKETYQNRVDDVLKNSGDSFSELREPVGQAYIKLCKRLNSYAEIGEKEEYKELADGLNIIIKKYNSILIMRRARKDETEDTEL
jgi:hypothetical protein